MNAQESRLEITKRDIELLSWILEQKFMTEKQVRRVFWKGVTEKSVESHRRLERLQKAGYLKTNPADIYRCLMYLGTKKGIDELRQVNQHSRLGELPDMNHRNYLHDLKVTEIRILFHEMGYKTWLSERVIEKRGGYRRIPDGMIFNRDKYTAIEYEYSQKAKRRYREIAWHYDLDRGIDQVLYIVEDPKLADTVLKEAHDCPKLHFASIKDIQSNLIQTKLTSISGNRTLQELLEPPDSR